MQTGANKRVMYVCEHAILSEVHALELDCDPSLIDQHRISSINPLAL